VKRNETSKSYRTRATAWCRSLPPTIRISVSLLEKKDAQIQVTRGRLRADTVENSKFPQAGKLGQIFLYRRTTNWIESKSPGRPYMIKKICPSFSNETEHNPRLTDVTKPPRPGIYFRPLCLMIFLMNPVFPKGVPEELPMT
jgi:hypothetical protein